MRRYTSSVTIVGTWLETFSDEEELSTWKLILKEDQSFEEFTTYDSDVHSYHLYSKGSGTYEVVSNVLYLHFLNYVKVVGNSTHEDGPFTELFPIKELTKTTLILDDEGWEEVLTRQN